MLRSLLLASVLMSSVVVAAPLVQRPLLITTHELSPYSFIDGHGAVRGFAVERVRCALARMQQPYQLQSMSWPRAQDEVLTGHAELLLAAARTPERDAYATASIAIAPQIWAWYLPVGSPLEPTARAFRQQRRVASLAGAATYAHLQQQGYLHLSEARDMEQLLASLLSGDVDAVLANNLSMDQLLAQHQARPFVRALPYLDKPLVVYVNLAFSQAYPTFMPAFNDALAHCREQIPVAADEPSAPTADAMVIGQRLY